MTSCGIVLELRMAGALHMPQKIRLNYSLDEQTVQALDDYCKSGGRKAAEVARQVILDYLDTDAELALPPCVGHPTDKRADLWLQPASMASIDRRVKQERHVSRSALICSLLSNFLASRPPPKTTAITINIPIELLNRLGDAPEAAILHAIEESLTKELV